MAKGIKGFQKGIHYRTEFKSGNQHPLWKGNKVGYKSLHEWIIRNWGSAKNYFCECGKQALDWANITEIYNRSRRNWQPKCRSCHRKFDKIDTYEARKALKNKRKKYFLIKIKGIWKWIKK